MSSSPPEMSKQVRLPRGGVYVTTPGGAVQIGVPPETIKDSMALKLPIPAVFVVPPDLFERRRGLSLAEIEFPAYFNYFVLKRRARMVVEDERTATRLRTMMRESLFASRRPTNHEEFASSYPMEARPDFAKETDHFRRGPDGNCRDVDDLIEFCVMTDQGRVKIDDHLEIAKVDGPAYAIEYDGVALATLPATVEIPEKVTPSSARVAAFEPPAFGLTVLGASHGFDPDGKTTGFILWIGRRGILIDPPVDTTQHLRESGVMPKIIDGVILTHCHADHDSGVFAKLLEEGRTRLYTTPTILASFLKKYSALSGIAEEDLRRTFSYSPIRIGHPTAINGAELFFFYTLHSIPTLGCSTSAWTPSRRWTSRGDSRTGSGASSPRRWRSITPRSCGWSRTSVPNQRPPSHLRRQAPCAVARWPSWGCRAGSRAVSTTSGRSGSSWSPVAT